MQTTSTDNAFNDLFNVAVYLVCGIDGLTLVNFSDKLEIFVKHLVSEGFSADKMKLFLASIEKSMQKNDMVLLLDSLYAFSNNEGVKIVV